MMMVMKRNAHRPVIYQRQKCRSVKFLVSGNINIFEIVPRRTIVKPVLCWAVEIDEFVFFFSLPFVR